MQVPKSERPAFRKALKQLGYAWKDVTSNSAYRLFLGNRD